MRRYSPPRVASTAKSSLFNTACKKPMRSSPRTLQSQPRVCVDTDLDAGLLPDQGEPSKVGIGILDLRDLRDQNQNRVSGSFWAAGGSPARWAGVPIGQGV